MPRKYVKKRVPKRTYRKVKRAMAKKTKLKAKKNMDTKFVKVVWNGLLSPQQGPVGSSLTNYISAFCPLLATSSTEAGVGDVTKQNAYQIHALQYDKVRINSVKLTITPKANVLNMNTAQNEGSYNVSGDNRFHWVIDRDGIAPLSPNEVTPKLLAQYPSYKNYSAMKKASRTYSIKYPRGYWLDTANPFGTGSGAVGDSTMNTLGIFGGHSIYLQNLLEDSGEVFNEPWANWKVEYNCVFCGTKPVGVSIEDGAVVIRSAEKSYSELKPILTQPTDAILSSSG